MKKSNLLARLALLRDTIQDQEIQHIHALTVIDTLLDYLNDADIRKMVEEINL